jgi:glycine cleavage system H lipoate-binding protein
MPGDIFATKGTEYLLTIGYFILLIALVRFIAPRGAVRAKRGGTALRNVASWFTLADGYHYHPGHSWAVAEPDAVKVGLDDFTAQLLGRADAVELPRVGDTVHQGGHGWRVRANGRALAMVAPVAGEVVEVNPAVIATPALAADDPYGAGWLFKVRAHQPRASLRNLLSGDLAAAWLNQCTERLRAMPAAELGVLMPDGGAPVRGFGQILGPAEWERVSREFFLAD